MHLDLSGLALGAPYHYRLLAANAGGASEGDEEEFFTTGPPAVEGELILSVTDTEALLEASIQPRGFPTSYHVEYGPTASYGQSTQARRSASPTAPSTGSPSGSPASTPGTAYHWRFLADNTDPSLPGTGPAPGANTATSPPSSPPSPEAGCPNQALRGGAGAYLPDCRAYELVSPLEKSNADVIPPLEGTTGLPAALEESAISGDKLAYASTRAFAGSASSPFTSQYIARRDAGAGEWVTHSINPPRAAPCWRPPNSWTPNSKRSRRTSARPGSARCQNRRWPPARSRARPTSTGAPIPNAAARLYAADDDRASRR